MKKFVFLFFALLCNLGCFASVKLIGGSLSCLESEKNVAVCLDLSNIKYKKNRPFKEFLLKGFRVKDWEDVSLNCFVTAFNQKCLKYSFEVETVSNEAKYILDISPKNVKDDGSISGEAHLSKKSIKLKNEFIQIRK